MANKIATELREISISVDPFRSLKKLCDEAASEIERLENENAWLAKRISSGWQLKTN